MGGGVPGAQAAPQSAGNDISTQVMPQSNTGMNAGAGKYGGMSFPQGGGGNPFQQFQQQQQFQGGQGIRQMPSSNAYYPQAQQQPNMGGQQQFNMNGQPDYSSLLRSIAGLFGQQGGAPVSNYNPVQSANDFQLRNTYQFNPATDPSQQLADKTWAENHQRELDETAAREARAARNESYNGDYTGSAGNARGGRISSPDKKIRAALLTAKGVQAKAVPSSQGIDNVHTVIDPATVDHPAADIPGIHLRAGRMGKDGGGDVDYRGEHTAPGPESGAPLHDLSGVYPDDFYSSKGFKYYADMGEPHDRYSYDQAIRTKGDPEAPVWIYRAVPANVYKSALKAGNTGSLLGKGDWVTTSKQYAILHGEHALGGKGKYGVASKRVKAKDIYTNGDSIHEWGYHPQKSSDDVPGKSGGGALAAPGAHEEDGGRVGYAGGGADVGELEALKNEWDTKNIDHSISSGYVSRPDLITLSKIVVPKESRGVGLGSEAMRQLTAHADKHGKTISLTPDTNFGASSVQRLKDFYKSHGFVENKGRNKDFSINESMYRAPIKSTSAKSGGGRVGYAGGGGEDDPTVQKALGLTQQAQPNPVQMARRLNDQGLYSHAAEAAAALPQAKGSPQQMLAMLSSRGVKPDEIKHSGAQDTFGGQKAVTKDELAQHFEQNMPKIQETVLKDGETKYENYQLPKEPRGLPEDLKHQYLEGAEMAFRENEDNDSDWINNFRNEKEKEEWMHDWAANAAVNIGDIDHISDWHKPAKTKEDNYREILLHSPVKNQSSVYENSHWDEPNVIGHIRASDRDDGKTLHVEELQSDWGQDKRKGKGVPDHPLVGSTNAWTDLLLKRALREAASGEYDRMAWTPGEEQLKRFKNEGLVNYYDKIVPQRLTEIVKKLGHKAEIKPHFIDTAEGEKTLHSIRMTPELRAAIMRGLPVYKDGGRIGYGTGGGEDDPTVRHALSLTKGMN